MLVQYVGSPAFETYGNYSFATFSTSDSRATIYLLKCCSSIFEVGYVYTSLSVYCRICSMSYEYPVLKYFRRSNQEKLHREGVYVIHRINIQVIPCKDVYNLIREVNVDHG